VSPLLIGIAVFLGVSAIAGGLIMLLHQPQASKVEDRLDLLTGVGGSAKEAKQATLLTEPLDVRANVIEAFVERFGNIQLLFEQADVSLTVTKLLAISGILAVLGVALGSLAPIHTALVPLVAITLASVPLLWLLFRRSRRLKAFAVQLPEAMDMLARALRAGQSLASGMNMVSTEMPAPLGREFGRVFEEQNLGVPLEDALTSLSERLPNPDLRFFSTAGILQRQTGGDLAEILDKIGSLIRERFKIWGQIQALTGEGRLSGVVLLALPVLLFVAVYQLNPDYVKVLFTDPMGKKMLVGAIFMQVIGALVIRKIVNIKV